MKYSEGIVRVTGGSDVVHGIGTQFTRYVTPESMLTLHMVVGAWMIIKVVSDTELILSSGVNAIDPGVVTDLEYTISSDFTPMLMAPYPKRGDADHVGLMKRSFDLFDEAIGVAQG